MLGRFLAGNGPNLHLIATGTNRMASRFTLHGLWLSGQTYKVALMRSMCAEAYAYRHVDLRAGRHKTPEFLALNRYGRVPVLRDGDRASHELSPQQDAA
jgi:hypothetical protein